MTNRLAFLCIFASSALSAQDFDGYVAAAEARMRSRGYFLLADGDAMLKRAVVEERRIQTGGAHGANPHQADDGLLHDWVGSVFIPEVRLDRLVRMLQDYDHRAQYFGGVVSASKLLCRTGEDRFGASMRLRKPAAIDTENEIVWERVDSHRWQSRSYSTKVNANRYLLRLNSYWRFYETEQGVYVEAEAVTLSGRFNAAVRALGSLLGLTPEKSLKQTLELMRESASKPGLAFAAPPTGLPACKAY